MKNGESDNSQERPGGGRIRRMTEDSWKEDHKDEMGAGGICTRQYGYMTATDCLDRTSGAGGDHSYIWRGHFSKEKLVAST